MRVVRLYAGTDGVSHLEEHAIALRPDELGRISAIVQPGSGPFVRELRAGLRVDYHRAPRRQFVFVLEGTVTVHCADGESAAVGAGNAIFVEDVSGVGHRTQVVGRPALCLYVPVGAEFGIAQISEQAIGAAAQPGGKATQVRA